MIQDFKQVAKVVLKVKSLYHGLLNISLKYILYWKKSSELDYLRLFYISKFIKPISDLQTCVNNQKISSS